MARLTVGGNTGRLNLWSAQPPIGKPRHYAGWIWLGQDAAQEEDFTALYERYGDGIKIDMLSVAGKKDPEWTTYNREWKKQNSFIRKVFLFWK